MRCAFILFGLVLFPLPLQAQQPGNLLRNGNFQDDWITLLPETKNHHWCFPSEFFNRRDFNPDGWFLKGNWEWLDAEKPMGQRRLILRGPGTEVMQRVNWVAIHDDRQLEGFPDAGGYPVMKAATSARPASLVRDLTFRVKLAGADLPKDAGQLHLGLCPPGGTSTSDPMGTQVPPVSYASFMLPEGTFKSQWFEVKLGAADSLKAMQRAAKNAKDVPIPALVSASIHYTAKTGRLDVERAELLAAPGEAPNLLPNGDFEVLDKDGYPVGWTKGQKYRYFPPRHYYIFNTWHNANFPNRGFAAADALLPHTGKHSLRMIVPAGDELMVLSDPINLNQKESRLIEVNTWIKTDRLCMMQIDAITDDGQRLDGFNWIHKAPVSIGTDEWRQVRQVFRPRTPVKSLRLALCARGVNGYTLDDTGQQPQNNVVGTIWWDDVQLYEPEGASDIRILGSAVKGINPYVTSFDLGERLLGDNLCQVRLKNEGQADVTVGLEWKLTSPTGKAMTFRCPPKLIKLRTEENLEVPYVLSEPCPTAYSEYKAELLVVDGKGTPINRGEYSFGTWTTPIDIDLGALYLRPDQKQYVRMNFGFAHATMAKLKTVRLDLIRRGSGKVEKTWNVDASPATLLSQRKKIPLDLRDDFANLLLTDLDVSFLPLQPFAEPQRNWFLRATAMATDGKDLGSSDSQPFCRQGHQPAQPAIQTVKIKGDLLYVNDQPWLPFGVCYGHTPVYAGPADPGKYRDLANLPGWSMYDRHNSESSNRKQFDFNCMRYVAGSITDPKVLTQRWTGDNLYCSTAFAVPDAVFSMEDLFKRAGGKDKLDAYLVMCRTAPMVVSATPGIEEAFGLFQGATPQQLKGLEQAVDYLRKQTGKPVMTGHGGYWNRLEFEKVPYFDIYDPETEPLYPANLHTDLAPLVKGKDKVVWLRPQMYESIPYERWRFHTFVELMRGARGWQIAHGPGDSSLFRGLHGEIEYFKPIVASKDLGPKVTVEPWLEHWSRKHNGKTYIIAASTHGIPLGQWQTQEDAPKGQTQARVTAQRHELRDETNAYAIGQKAENGPTIHGIQYLPDARAWPKPTKLVQWVKLDDKNLPKNLVILAKADGRWTHAAALGKIDLASLRKDPATAYWFLNSFYRHAKGFLGWGMDLLPKSLEYIPDKATDLGALPAAGDWVKLEIPLEKLGAVDKLLDGIGFLHEGGRVSWGHTSLVAPDGTEQVVWGNTVELPQEQLAKVKISVAGLKAGTKIRVLFEDRELVAVDGYFIDDLRGQDLYQRYGGGPGTGYGDAPVALRLYEVP